MKQTIIGTRALYVSLLAISLFPSVLGANRFKGLKAFPCVVGTAISCEAKRGLALKAEQISEEECDYLGKKRVVPLFDFVGQPIGYCECMDPETNRFLSLPSGPCINLPGHFGSACRYSIRPNKHDSPGAWERLFLTQVQLISLIEQLYLAERNAVPVFDRDGEPKSYCRCPE